MTPTRRPPPGASCRRIEQRREERARLEGDDTAADPGDPDDVALAAMDGGDRLEAEDRGQSPAEYLREECGVDPTEYDDPRAQQAHEQAQQRDPSDVVDLGEEIELVLREVDHSSREGTVMGRKNDLVIFVDEVPQDVSRLDIICATVYDCGSGNSCAKAEFTGYGDLMTAGVVTWAQFVALVGRSIDLSNYLICEQS